MSQSKGGGIRWQFIPVARTDIRNTESDEETGPFLGRYSWPGSVRALSPPQLLWGRGQGKGTNGDTACSLSPPVFISAPQDEVHTCVDTPAHKLSSVGSSPCSWPTAASWPPLGWTLEVCCSLGRTDSRTRSGQTLKQAWSHLGQKLWPRSRS